MMKRHIKVLGFCEDFLEPLQDIAIVDFENDKVYYKGKAQDFIGAQSNKCNEYLGDCYTMRISPYYALDDKLRIQLEI